MVVREFFLELFGVLMVLALALVLVFLVVFVLFVFVVVVFMGFLVLVGLLARKEPGDAKLHAGEAGSSRCGPEEACGESQKAAGEHDYKGLVEV